MPLTHEQIALVRWSFDKLRPRIRPASTFFYEELFRLRPDLRAMFRADDIAGQGMKFMTTLESVLDNIETPQALADRIVELGQQHRRLGVRADMFPPMEEALIATIRDGLDGDLGADVETAWRTAYADLSAAMIDKGDIPEDA